MKEKRTLLMVYVQWSTFIKRDVALLESDYKITTYCFKTKHKLLTPFAFIHQFFYLLLYFKKYEACVVQSSGYASYLPTLLGRIYKVPTTIIAIGMDCAKLPEINYGAHRSGLLSWFTKKSFLQAHKILPVHKSLIEQTYTYAKVKDVNQGIKAFCPTITTPIVEVVNGYHTEKWKVLKNRSERVENSFLTVSMVTNEVGFQRKGLDLILEVAKLFPNYKFSIVGGIHFIKEIPENVTIIAPVAQEQLLALYNKHEYYFQLSMFEGFPNALCEAMLCGCIPIGSHVSGIPDIIGAKGFVLTTKDTKELISLIKEAQESDFTSQEIRKRIVENYSLEKRKTALLNEINS